MLWEALDALAALKEEGDVESPPPDPDEMAADDWGDRRCHVDLEEGRDK